MFLLLNNYTVDDATLLLARDAHVTWISEQIEAGKVVLAGRQNPPVGGVILIHADSRAEAEAFAAADPYAKEGYATYQVVEFNAAIARPELLERADPPVGGAR